MDLLRFLTAGNVDDGKSTLIGRLLYDSKSILADQLQLLEERSNAAGKGQIDLAHLTDGLRSEREQGITIDVAYKYFSTPKRKFIIADTPGHIQYTRNMITGASTADAVVILIDARTGITEQTKRHSIIASLLGIKHVVVAINKMDLVSFDEKVYRSIQESYRSMVSQLSIQNTYYIPVSALLGDNIVQRSEHMPWYNTRSLLETLENIQVQKSDSTSSEFSLMVQHILRPQEEELHDYRGYSGKVLTGSISRGDIITILPSGLSSRVKSIYSGGKEVDRAETGVIANIELEEDIDISRGDILTTKSEFLMSNEISATLCWMDEQELRPGQKFILRQHARDVRSVVASIEYLIDINTLDRKANPEAVNLNGIAKIKIKTQRPLTYEPMTSGILGTAILINETTHQTSGALLLE
jgi:sulfate adenylyltransferase subunit 1